jgi:hypothetical protein
MMPKFANSATGAEKQMLKRYRNVNDGVVSAGVTVGAGTRWPIAGLGCKGVPYKKGFVLLGCYQARCDRREEWVCDGVLQSRAVQFLVWKGAPLEITGRGVVDVGYEQEGPRSEGKWLDCNGREWGVGGGPRQPYLEVGFSQMATQLGSGLESLWPFVSTCVGAKANGKLVVEFHIDKFSDETRGGAPPIGAYSVLPGGNILPPWMEKENPKCEGGGGILSGVRPR